MLEEELEAWKKVLYLVQLKVSCIDYGEYCFYFAQKVSKVTLGHQHVRKLFASSSFHVGIRLGEQSVLFLWPCSRLCAILIEVTKFRALKVLLKTLKIFREEDIKPVETKVIWGVKLFTS